MTSAGLVDDGAAFEANGIDDGATGLAGGVAAYLAEGDQVDRALGRAMAFASQAAAGALHVIAEPGEARAGLLARRAGAMAAHHRPSVWAVVDGGLERADEATFPARRPRPDSQAALVAAEMLIDAGAEVVVEDGVLVGEVLGLEIARWTDDGDGPRLAVGVGRHDREAFELLHGHLPPVDALHQVIAAVSGHRRSDSDHHPLKRLAGERWLRRAVQARPEVVGCSTVRAADPPVARTGVMDPRPAVAVGERDDGGATVIVTSTGIDLDLVPFAADARTLHDPDADLLLVVPDRDAHPVTLRMATMLERPAEVVRVEDGWRSWVSVPSLP